MFYHPNAYIPSIINKSPGLEKRTKILNILAERKINLKNLQQKTGIKTSTLNYHLKLLEKHGIVKRRRIGKGVVIEELGMGQRTIKEYF